jgi:hypothetical protein
LIRRNAREQRAAEVLADVGLGDRIHHKPNELSVVNANAWPVARALVNRTSIILADEPTGNLDSKTGEKIMALFEDLYQRGEHDHSRYARARHCRTCAAYRALAGWFDPKATTPDLFRRSIMAIAGLGSHMKRFLYELGESWKIAAAQMRSH